MAIGIPDLANTHFCDHCYRTDMTNMAEVSVEEFLRQPATLLYMGPNPHRLGSNAHAMYEKARCATSVGEIRSMGISL